MWDTIIVGAGPAGLMAGIQTARRGQQVCILEKTDRPGKKLRITGKGRCNVTNCCTVEDFMPNVLANPRFLYSSLNAFTPYEVMGFFEELGVPLDGVEPANVYLAVDGRPVGGIVLSDKPRPQAAQAIQELKKLGIQQTVMLTGDGRLSAQAVQQACGIDRVHTDLLPQDKAALLQKEKQQGHGVLFVGDGINDAPVLAAADVGIAMGLGTDAAIESADAVLMSENLQDLGRAIALSRRAVSIVRFNLWFILLVKLAVFVLGIAGLAQMWMAVFADVGVSILSVLNAVRILKTDGKKAE